MKNSQQHLSELFQWMAFDHTVYHYVLQHTVYCRIVINGYCVLCNTYYVLRTTYLNCLSVEWQIPTVVPPSNTTVLFIHFGVVQYKGVPEL